MLRGLKQEGSIRLLTFIDALECSLARDSTPHEVRRRSSVYPPSYRGSAPVALAGRQGFEPRFYGSEPHVLPLDDLPVREGEGVV